MRRNDRRAGEEAFERLWVLRACYPYRSAYDARVALTVADAIDYGERLMRLQHRRLPFDGIGHTGRAA